MKVIEKLNFDQEKLDVEFKKYAEKLETPEYDYSSRYYDLLNVYDKFNYKIFLNWAFEEFKDFSNGDITPSGYIIVNSNLSDVMKVEVLDIFSTGWTFHLDLLKENGEDLSKPFVGYETIEMRQFIDNEWTEESEKQLLKRIDDILEEHDPNIKDLGKINVYQGLTDKEKQFYIEYDKVLKVVKECVLNKTYKLNVSYIKKILTK